MSDELSDGRQIRVLTIVDHFSWESLAILVDGNIGGRRAAGALALLALRGRMPQNIAMDNVPQVRLQSSGDESRKPTAADYDAAIPFATDTRRASTCPV